MWRRNFPGFVTILFFCQLFLGSLTYASLQIQIGQNFAGSDNSTAGITPADSNGAIGPEHFVEFINGQFAIYFKTNGALVSRISDDTFWANAGVNIPVFDVISDPRI